MKKILNLFLVFALLFSFCMQTGATAVTKDAYTPTYEVKLNGETVEGSLYNIDGNTYFRARTLETAGVNVGWDENKRIATFDIPQENKFIDQYEAQKTVVRIMADVEIITTELDENEEEVETTDEALKLLGNGFFIEGRKILTTRDVYETYKKYLGEENVGTDTGDESDTVTNITGIKIILSDGRIKEAKNFRFDDDRILGTLDTMGYTSKDIVTLGKNMKVGDTSYMCTSIESTIENPKQVANQWSVNKVLRTRYPRDNQYFTLIKNNTDNMDSGRGGAVFNQQGKLTGIFCAVEIGNNGNALVKPVSEIKEFLND